MILNCGGAVVLGIHESDIEPLGCKSIQLELLKTVPNLGSISVSVLLSLDGCAFDLSIDLKIKLHQIFLKTMFSVFNHRWTITDGQRHIPTASFSTAPFSTASQPGWIHATQRADNARISSSRARPTTCTREPL